MALENVRLEDGNLCTDRDHLYVASFSYSEQSVVEVDKTTGVVQKAWPTDSTFTAVSSLGYDGFYWWTLESQTNGFVVRKWKRKDNIFAKLVSTFSYSGPGMNTRAMAVEYYNTTLTAQAVAGDTVFYVTDASDFRIGDTVVLGPSTVVGYIDDYEEISIINVVGNAIYTSTGLRSSFQSGGAAYTTRAFWVFVDGVSGGKGDIIKYSANTGNFLLSDCGILYSGIASATFFSGKVLFQKGNEVFWITPSTTSIYQVMAVDNLRADRSTIIPIAGMYGYGDYLYRLQNRTAYESAGQWYDEVWSSYNVASSKTVPEVYMIALSADKSVLHAVDLPYVTTASSSVYCTVYDQYFSPAAGEVVDFTTTAGNLVSSQEITDSNGFCSTVYLGDGTIGLVKITATT